MMEDNFESAHFELAGAEPLFEFEIHHLTPPQDRDENGNEFSTSLDPAQKGGNVEDAELGKLVY